SSRPETVFSLRFTVVSSNMSFAKPHVFRSLLSIAITLFAVLTGVFFTGSSLADQPKDLTAEQVAESAIAIAGNGFGRAVLAQIRKNGIEGGRETRTRPDGRAEETRYEMRFVHGDKPDKDKIRIDNKTAQAEYSLVWGGGRLFGIINGATFTPRADATAEFI